MFRTEYFVFFYGAVAIVGALLTLFWGRFSYRRCTSVPHPCWKDRAFVMSFGVSVLLLGSTLDYAARAYGNLQFGLSRILQRDEAYVIGLGLLLVLSGALILTWLADLEKHPPRWSYLRGAVVVTALWLLLVVLIAPKIPLDG